MIATKMGIAAYGVLRRARKSLGLSQTAVAKKIGISPWQFNRVENGHDHVTDDQFFRWAAAVGCTVKVTRNNVEF